MKFNVVWPLGVGLLSFDPLRPIPSLLRTKLAIIKEQFQLHTLYEKQGLSVDSSCIVLGSGSASVYFAGSTVTLQIGRLFPEANEANDAVCQTECASGKRIAASYKQHGQALCRDLRGEFTASVYDIEQNALLLLRDHSGSYPLYYWHDEHLVIWSTHLHPLVVLTNAVAQRNNAFDLSFIIDSPSAESTLYLGIKQVPPGCTYLATLGSSRTSRYWDPAKIRPSKLCSDEEYELQYMYLFDQSVTRRLARKGRTTIELSGGLDSTSIWVAAAEAIRRIGGDKDSLRFVSFSYDVSMSGNEDKFIASISDLDRFSGLRIPESQHPLLEPGSVAPLISPNQKYLFAMMYEAAGKYAASVQSTSHLGGLGGDQVLWSRDLFYPPAHLGYFRSDHTISAWAAAQKWTYGEIIREAFLKPVLPYFLRKRLVSVGMEGPPFLNEHFVMEKRIELLSYVTDVSAKDMSIGMLRRIQMLGSAVSAASACRHHDFFTTPVSFPYLDVDLVNFLISVPSDQLFRPGQSRSLQRRAMRHLLPAKILKRESKAGPSEAICRGIQKHYPLIKLLMADAEWLNSELVDRGKFMRALELAQCGNIMWSGGLSSSIVLEFWKNSGIQL